jgi:hypothetical protein
MARGIGTAEIFRNTRTDLYRVYARGPYGLSVEYIGYRDANGVTVGLAPGGPNWTPPARSWLDRNVFTRVNIKGAASPALSRGVRTARSWSGITH